MKKKHKALALLTAFAVGVASITSFHATDQVSAAQTTYESGKVYDATETYFKVQPQQYSYNGYKMRPFGNCDTYLSDNGLGNGYALSTVENIKTGDKVVIEFKEPIDSRKFETVSISMKQVPGNSYDAYNASDDILSTVRKSFQIGSYDIEKISFSTSLFAGDDGMVRAIILQNKKADMEGQLFIDSLEVGNSPYKLNQEYDAAKEYLKGQSATNYQGMTVVPFGEFSTFWDKEAKLEKGSALIASKPEGAALVKGDTLILEFVHEISADKFPYLNLKLTTTTGGGASFEFYNVSDIENGKLGTVKAKGNVAFWNFDTVSLPTKAFADKNGKVSAVAMKLVSDEAATFSVGSFSLTGKQVQSAGGNSGTVNAGNDTKNQYDGTKENIVVQTSATYKGIKIRPLDGCGTELAGWGVGEGYAVYTNGNVEKGDVIVIEFVKPIDSKEVDIITMSLKQIPGYSYSVYKGNDTKLEKKIKTLDFGSYDIEKTAFRTSLFAETDGMVRALILRCEKAEEPGQFFIDGYSLGQDPYKKGVTYDVDENYIKLQSAGTYKGLTIAPFGERTTFWSKEAKVDTDQGYGVVAHRADNTDLKKNDLMILEFVTDINVNKFEVLNLTLATAEEKGAILEVYNVSEMENGKLGTPKQRVTADFWSFRTNNISLKALADENGYVGAIGLRLLSDGAKTFTVGSFSLGSLSDLVEQDAPQILDNKITVFETADAYEFTIEFNSTGSMSGTYNEKNMGDMVSFNGVKLSEINKEKTNITLSVDLMGRYCMTLRVDKDYEGKGKVINTERHFVGNYVQIEKGFRLPNGEELEETYALHVYLTDGITNIVEEETLLPIGINYLTSGLDENNNLTINVYFNNQITGNPMYFLCNPDSFNKKEVAKLNGETILYDENMAEAFIYGGYKSALLDHVKINGNTLAEWMAMDELKGSPGYNTAVMVHYGQMGDKVASIIITANTKIGEILNKSYEEGELHVLLEAGLKFTSGRAVLEDMAYAYDGVAWEKVSADAFAVYYDGQKVEDGDEITVETLVSVDNITVMGAGEYKIEESVSGNTATYTIWDGEEKKLSFSVKGGQVIPTGNTTISYIPIVAGGILIVILGLAGIVILTGRRKKHAEEKAD